MAETILEPDLPIVDPHHHLWDRRNVPAPQGPEHPFMTAIADARRYLLDELLADTGSGHKVIATVFVECGAFYKADIVQNATWWDRAVWRVRSKVIGAMA